VKKSLSSLSNLFFVFVLAIGLFSCGGAPPQVSGIVAKASFETTACQPQEKTLKVRNNDPEKPQRVQGVLFEMGTNNDRFYKIEDVTVNGIVKKAVADQVDEIQLPAGAVMSIRVTYNPKKVTVGDELQKTYVDVFLNGPKLGIMQIELDGKAPQALAGCGTEDANAQEFDVVAVKTTLSHKDLGANVVSDLDVSTAVQGTFKLNVDGETASIKTSGWPTITFPLPAGSPIPEMAITLADDSPEGTFSADGKLSIEGMAFSGSNVVNLADITLTTDSITIGSDKAPNVLGGTITFTGSPLNDQGEMTIVIAAPLTVPPVDTVAKVGGGVFGLEVKLKKK